MAEVPAPCVAASLARLRTAAALDERGPTDRRLKITDLIHRVLHSNEAVTRRIPGRTLEVPSGVLRSIGYLGDPEKGDPSPIRVLKPISLKLTHYRRMAA